MTREEERQQAAIDYCNNLIREATFGQFVAHKAGSKWADETMINKACEWLLEWETHQGEDIEIVEQFRKAMKGGEI